MFCSNCGTDLGFAGAFCGKCGARVNQSTVAAGPVRRPAIITLLAVLQFIGGGIWLLVGTIGLLVTAAEPPGPDRAFSAWVFAFFLALSIYQIACGVGLVRLRGYGRVMQLVASVIGLLAIPIGTIISIAILVYLNKPGMKVLFSGKKPEEMSAQELNELATIASGGSGTAIVLAAVVVLLVFFVGIVAAIAIPSLLRARMSANEAGAIATLRTIAAAEDSYAVHNGGYYGTLTCLAQPVECLPAYTGGAFLPEPYALKSGYRFEFIGGAAPTSTFSVVATPVSSSTGTRLFCLDHTGAVRAGRATAEADVASGSCPVSWLPIK